MGLVVDGAVDLSATFVIDSLTVNGANDKGGAHVQGAVDANVCVFASW